MEQAAKANRIAIIDGGHIVANATLSELKEKYATDQLKLVAHDEACIIKQLENMKLDYRRNSNHIKVSMPNSLSAIRVLNKVQNSILSFEMIQGTMEDVFFKYYG